ncbi:hypothetical protein Zm00014a_005859 [Zea mays]|uniref:Uncharacterized protein n=1 Tax=Zea mays TaxID=4577 RepID=A0A3L6F5A6_MAIZE|nr:hypothetical protein Zm00014a_005859 [Zea mays]
MAAGGAELERLLAAVMREEEGALGRKSYCSPATRDTGRKPASSSWTWGRWSVGFIP